MSKRAIERWKRLKETGSGDGVIEVPSIDSGIAQASARRDTRSEHKGSLDFWCLSVGELRSVG